VDHFIADSRHVQDRISRCYGRAAELVYPPVETDFFTPAQNADGVRGFYLIVSALVPYKRLDLAIDAFNELGRSLVVVGSGPDLPVLKKRARANIEFRGFVSQDELRTLYRQCRAVVIPGREDFGLASLEAQACGRPAVAYGAGGSLESITDGVTGVLFREQTPQALGEAIRRLEGITFNPRELRANAERFSADRFRQSISAMVEKAQSSSNGRTRSAVGPIRPARQPHPSLSGLIPETLPGYIGLRLAILVCPFFTARRTTHPPGPGSRSFGWARRRPLRWSNFDHAKTLSWAGPTAVSNDPRCTRWVAGCDGTGWMNYRSQEHPWGDEPGSVRARAPEFHRIRGRNTGIHATSRGASRSDRLAQMRGWRGDTSVEERLRRYQYIETCLQDLDPCAPSPDGEIPRANPRVR
jgi:hypothetical protein